MKFIPGLRINIYCIQRTITSLPTSKFEFLNLIIAGTKPLPKASKCIKILLLNIYFIIRIYLLFLKIYTFKNLTFGLVGLS